ncbi:hypothetical protein BLNAU_17159 [Blattamonas nauphoetae]|uniref:Secreted protein n=1 Tax=Blattamonas nauphoetae TaxID=2049346 RepID=A0ABQ9X7T3_9EUKA|nr:hypothetical protein BLNAU_17159 [Blattamonas nauphoetae]
MYFKKPRASLSTLRILLLCILALEDKKHQSYRIHIQYIQHNPRNVFRQSEDSVMPLIVFGAEEQDDKHHHCTQTIEAVAQIESRQTGEAALTHVSMQSHTDGHQLLRS